MRRFLSRSALLVSRPLIMRTLWKSFLLPLFITSGLHAAILTVDVTTAGASAEPVSGTVVLTLLSNGGNALGPEHKVAVGAPGSARIDLAAGTWSLRTDAPGHLPTVRTITVADDAHVQIILSPAARVKGIIRRARKSDSIRALTLTYRHVHPPAPGVDGQGEVECAVRQSQFDCLAPAGTIDYNLHARAFASHYRWGEKLVAQKTVDIGAVAFLRGASLVGRVVAGTGIRIGNVPVDVVLRPVGFAGAGEVAERNKLQERRTRVNDRGFFQLDGLTPGKYEVRASSAKLVSPAVDVTIIGTSEAELRAPLVLSPPTNIRVSITPPLDPHGNPWSVELSAVDSVANHRRVVQNTDADFSGTWTGSSLVPGTYWLTVRRGPQASWYFEELEIAEDRELAIDIPAAKVSGRVTRGGEPVEGFLWFGGDRGAVSIPVRTRKDGTFDAVLPRMPDDTWPEIDVVSDDPPLRRALYGVKLEREDSGSDSYDLSIALPNRGVFGQVRKGEQAVAHATVFLASDDLQRMVDLETRPDGGYGFDGLAPGGYTVRAVAGDRRSKSVGIVLSEGDQVQTVDLELLDLGQLTGRLVAAGRPIAAGRVWAVPADRAAAAVTPTETSLDGTFSIPVPAGARHMAIVASAPGFGLSYADTALPLDDVELDITTDAATLDLQVADADTQFGRGLLPVLIHRGTFLPVALAAAFSGTAERSHDENVQRTRFGVEPGEYMLCYARQVDGGGETRIESERCARGIATAGGVLSLKIEGTGPRS